MKTARSAAPQMGRPGAPIESISSTLETAAAHHRAGRLAEAESGYRQVLTIDPNQGDALHLLGVLAYQTGHFQEALRCLEPVVARYPDIADFRSNLANALRELGRREEAAEHYQRAIELAPNQAPVHADYAWMLACQNDWVQAETHYRTALTLDPTYRPAINNLANLLLQTDRAAECLALSDQALATQTDDPLALASKGGALQSLGRVEESIAPLRRAVELRPDLAPARAALASAFAVLSRFGEAQAHYQKALEVSPDNAKLHAERGWVMRHLGDVKAAIDHLLRALELQPDYPEARNRLLRTLLSGHTATYVPALDDILLDASQSPDVEVQSLALPLANQIRLKHICRKGDPLSDGGRAAEILCDPLSRPLLMRTVNCSPEFEQDLIAMRRGFLLEGTGTLDGQAALMAISLLAHQAHNNSYAWWSEADEDETIQRLKSDLTAALAVNINPGEDLANGLLRYAMYAPLSSLENAAALLDIDPEQWSAPMRPILEATLREPAEEQAIAQDIPLLSPIADDVSREVQSMYEENPYPRWLSLTRCEEMTLAEYFRAEFPGFEPPAWMANPYDVLIAGCGTGRQPIQHAIRHPQAGITAVDLSRRSIAYAIRMGRIMDVDNIEYLQGDILELDNLERQFPVIECSGVLHHMEDPVAAWSVLTDLLEPGGVLLLGLYSEIARQKILAARERIADLGLKPEPNDIRAFRNRIVRGDDDEDKQLAQLKINADFYDLHGCRDLIFHSHEKRFSVPLLAQTVADQGLEFLGFIFDDPASKMLYAGEFPDDPDKTNLDYWAAFEQRHPHTFASMYQFWCRKPE